MSIYVQAVYIALPFPLQIIPSRNPPFRIGRPAPLTARIGKPYDAGRARRMLGSLKDYHSYNTQAAL
jgi:hypothetical protein